MTSLAVAIGVAVLLLAAGAVVLLRRALGQRKQLQRLEAELARLRQEAGRLDQDPLTGLGNRAALSRWLETPRAEAGWLVVCDLDDFKQLNDRYGHLVGDEVLRGAGQLIAASIRAEDRAYRWGGDEFAIFFNQSERAVVEARLRELEEHLLKFQVRNHGPLPVRFRWGLAATGGRPLQDSLEEADQRMLEAKRERQAGATATE
jgi:diguanylate cyclase (GGDEF)-like protein